MEFTSEYHRDIARYYENTYVKLPEFGEKLFFITNVTSQEVLFLDEKGAVGVIYLDNENPYPVDFILPHRSLFQVGNHCFSMSRVPARQYQRGISNGNCAIAFLQEDGAWRNTTMTWDRLNSFVTKQPYVSILAGEVLGLCSVALSQRFAYSCSQGWMYCDHKRIGGVSKETDRYNLQCNKLLEPELRTLLLQNGDATQILLNGKDLNAVC